jgi:hypothetical protein
MTNEPPHSPHSPEPERTTDTINVFNRVFLMSGKRQNQPEQYAEYHEQSLDLSEPPTDFGWQTISARCTRPSPNHPAYGMNISEYIRQRGVLMDKDDTGKSQISFRVPPMIAMGLPRMARKHSITPTRYLTFILEHGLITFQKDYYDTYSAINYDLDKLFDRSVTASALEIMSQSLKQTIYLGSASRDNKLFGPHLQEWMSGAIKSTSLELNCTQSDMAYLCILIGIRTDSTEYPLPLAYTNLVDATISKFEFELGMLKLRVTNLLSIET